LAVPFPALHLGKLSTCVCRCVPFEHLLLVHLFFWLPMYW
jgi:hypothetical protein